MYSRFVVLYVTTFWVLYTAELNVENYLIGGCPQNNIHDGKWGIQTSAENNKKLSTRFGLDLDWLVCKITPCDLYGLRAVKRCTQIMH